MFCTSPRRATLALALVLAAVLCTRVESACKVLQGDPSDQTGSSIVIKVDVNTQPKVIKIESLKANSVEFVSGTLAAKVVGDIFANDAHFSVAAKTGATNGYTAIMNELETCKNTDDKVKAILPAVKGAPGFLVMDFAASLSKFFIKSDGTFFTKCSDISTEDLEGVGRNYAFAVIMNGRDKWPLYKRTRPQDLALKDALYATNTGIQNTFFDFATHKAIPLDMPIGPSIFVNGNGNAVDVAVQLAQQANACKEVQLRLHSSIPSLWGNNPHENGFVRALSVYIEHNIDARKTHLSDDQKKALGRGMKAGFEAIVQKITEKDVDDTIVLIDALVRPMFDDIKHMLKCSLRHLRAAIFVTKNSQTSSVAVLENQAHERMAWPSA